MRSRWTLTVLHTGDDVHFHKHVEQAGSYCSAHWIGRSELPLISTVEAGEVPSDMLQVSGYLDDVIQREVVFSEDAGEVLQRLSSLFFDRFGKVAGERVMPTKAGCEEEVADDDAVGVRTRRRWRTVAGEGQVSRCCGHFCCTFLMVRSTNTAVRHRSGRGDLLKRSGSSIRQ